MNAATTLIHNATVLDASRPTPLYDHSIVISGERISAIVPAEAEPVSESIHRIDASGKFVIPGLLNANVHLFQAVSLERLVRHLDALEDVILQSAQVALASGLTTIFDTWGPRRALMNVRDRINRGELVGSRIYCAGNIIGFDGPLSKDFLTKAAEVAGAPLADRVNAIWVENVGRYLMWLGPEQVAQEVTRYIDLGIDFVKYASNEHFWAANGAFLTFSARVQAAIVDAAHRAGRSAQAHTLSPEGLHIAVEAGCDLIQHANITGPVPILPETLEMMAQRGTGAVVFPMMQSRLDWLSENESYRSAEDWATADRNARALIASGVPLLLANDGAIFAEEAYADPYLSKLLNSYGKVGEDNLFDLATGHFVWLKAMEEKGMKPHDLLAAATLNIAKAYGKASEIGSIEVGKLADLLILDRNPLERAEHYQSIASVMKGGMVVDRSALPERPVLNSPFSQRIEEDSRYRRFLTGGAALPMCPCCLGR